jgi:hypothetical protein
LSAEFNPDLTTNQGSEESSPEAKKKPTSQRKIDANRRNAQKSTGPKTPRGRANSRLNAVKHGIFTRHRSFFAHAESKEEYRELLQALLDRFKPRGKDWEYWVHYLADAMWKLQRTSRHEDAINRAELRDKAKEELDDQEDWMEEKAQEENMIRTELLNATNEIRANGEISEEQLKKLSALRRDFGPFWKGLIAEAEQLLAKPPLLDFVKAHCAPHERVEIIQLLAIGLWGLHLQEAQRNRAENVYEIAIAQHLIPNKENIDRILRYERSVNRKIDFALRMLDRLQRWSTRERYSDLGNKPEPGSVQ